MDEWYKSRTYKHLDRQIKKSIAIGLATDEEFVAKRSWLPFIKWNMPKFKSGKFDNGKHKTLHGRREICISSHLDSHIYAYYSCLLGELYEKQLQQFGLCNCVIAYRKFSPSKNNADFAKIAFDYISQLGNCTAYKIDVSDFFGSIDHALLKERWKELLNQPELPPHHYSVFKSITRYAFVWKKAAMRRFNIGRRKSRGIGAICENLTEGMNLLRTSGLIRSNKRSFGIPQGSPISALLSNIYLVEFDRRMLQYANEKNSLYLRYSDDILLVVPGNSNNSTIRFVKCMLRKFRLTTNNSKVSRVEYKYENNEVVVTSKKPLDYLGFTFDGTRVYMRDSTIRKYYWKLNRRIRHLRSKTWTNIVLNKLDSGTRQNVVRKRSLFSTYSHLGLQRKSNRSQRNFYAYVLKSSKKLNNESVLKQMRNHWPLIHKKISKRKPRSWIEYYYERKAELLSRRNRKQHR
jgi:hypothetical protein